MLASVFHLIDTRSHSTNIDGNDLAISAGCLNPPDRDRAAREFLKDRFVLDNGGLYSRPTVINLVQRLLEQFETRIVFKHREVDDIKAFIRDNRTEFAGAEIVCLQGIDDISDAPLRDGDTLSKPTRREPCPLVSFCSSSKAPTRRMMASSFGKSRRLRRAA